jgi:hypothetical protein
MALINILGTEDHGNSCPEIWLRVWDDEASAQNDGEES